MSAAVERVRPLVAPILADLGLDLYDLEMVSGTVRVTVDRDGGVDLEAISLATRLISRELDHSDPIPSRYTLEVSSPGLERNLRTPDHFARVIGWKVQVRTLAHVDGDRRVHGVLLAADDTGFTVRPELDGGGLADDRRIAYVDVDRAKTVFDWAGQPKPGQPKSGQPKSGQPKSGQPKSGRAGTRPPKRSVATSHDDPPATEQEEATTP